MVVEAEGAGHLKAARLLEARVHEHAPLVEGAVGGEGLAAEGLGRGGAGDGRAAGAEVLGRAAQHARVRGLDRGAWGAGAAGGVDGGEEAAVQRLPGRHGGGVPGAGELGDLGLGRAPGRGAARAVADWPQGDVQGQAGAPAAPRGAGRRRRRLLVTRRRAGGRRRAPVVRVEAHRGHTVRTEDSRGRGALVGALPDRAGLS